MTVSTSFEWNGNVVEKVELAGSFTQWEPVEMEKISDEKWSLKLDLSPGEHEFKFLVDGNWLHDELLPTKISEVGSKNNIVIVDGKFVFIYRVFGNGLLYFGSLDFQQGQSFWLKMENVHVH